MKRKTAVAVLATSVLAFLAGFLLSSGPAASAPASTLATIAPPTTAVIPAFVQQGEIVIGPAAVVPGDLQLDGNIVVLDFSVHDLAPVGDAAAVTQLLGFQATEVIPAEELATVYLDSWVLVTADSEIPGQAANPTARTARFEVGPGFSLAAIEQIRLDSYSLRIPLDVRFHIDLDNDTVAIGPGLSARLLAVTEQAHTIIQVELISDHDFNYDTVAITGVGPGWQSAVREAEGRPRWNLTYDAPEAPSPIPLRLEGAVWVDIADETLIWEAGDA
jgi:hypothetical protein